MVEQIVKNLVEVSLLNPDDFLKIKETLTRIGIASRKEDATRNLYQTCHILHKKGKYYIVHFKELFLLDGKSSTIDENDIARRNTIIQLLEDWSLLTVIDRDKITDTAPLTAIKIVSHKEKKSWNLIPKYSIGNK